MKKQKKALQGENDHAWCMPLLIIGKVYRIKLQKPILKFIFTLFLQQYQNWENKIQQCHIVQFSIEEWMETTKKPRPSL
jgi:hypothetical protein